VSFTGALAGDVTGNQGSTTVNRIQGNPVQSGVPGDGNVLAYSDANDRWEFVSAPSLGDPSYGSSASSPVNAVFVDDSGDVGIGTTNPTVGYKLDVNGSGFFNGSVAVFGVMNSVSTMVNGQSALERTTTNLKVAPAPFYQSLSLFTNGSERVTVDASGNVGIATITPGAALDVKGAVRISGATSGFVGLAVPAAAGATTYTFPSAPAAGKFLKTDGSGGLTWDDPAGAGDMLKATYDAGNNGKVDTADNADQLGGQGGSYYLNAANLTGSLADARLSANVSLLGPSISDSEIVDLDAGKLTGSLADARLSANVSLLGSSISNAEIVDLDAAKLTGTIADARLSANVSLLGASISNAEISDISGGKINAGTVGRAFLETMTGDSGAGGASGAVPAPGAGDAAASKFLKADGTWSTVSVGAINSLAASDGTPAQAVYVDADGAVGIGTASPSAKLHVAGTAGIDGIKFPDGTLQTTAAFAASACAVGFTSLEFNGRRLGCIQNDEANGGAGLNWPDANNFCYDNFGGTLPPMEMLNLSFARLALANEADDMEWSADQEAAAGIRAMTLSGPSTSASATVAPTPFRCWVAGNGAGSGVSGAWSDTGSDIYRNTGNVGIGTTTPEAKLHVGAGHILLDNDHALKGKQVGGSSFDLVRINSDDAVSFYGYQGNLAMNPVNGANYLHASDGGPPRMTLLNGGNVGIGTTDPQAALHVVGATGIRAQQLCDVSGSNCKDISLGWGGSGNVAYGAHGSAGTDRIYVGSTGMVSVNTTSSPFFAQFHVEESNSGGYAASFRNAGGVGAHGLLIYAGHDTTSGSNFAIFRRPDGTTIGTISQNSATTVAYNTTSDRRLKENVAHSSSGLGMLRLINVYDYNYIGEPTSVRRQGYLAQELYEIYPEAVTVGGADASKAPWQVDYGKLTPLLTKSLQEVDAKTENLQTQVDSLESENARLKVMLNELREHICRSSDAPDFCR